MGPYSHHALIQEYESAVGRTSVGPTQQQPTRSGFVRLPGVEVRWLTACRTLYVPAYSTDDVVGLPSQSSHLGYLTPGFSPYRPAYPSTRPQSLIRLAGGHDQYTSVAASDVFPPGYSEQGNRRVYSTNPHEWGSANIGDMTPAAASHADGNKGDAPYYQDDPAARVQNDGRCHSLQQADVPSSRDEDPLFKEIRVATLGENGDAEYDNDSAEGDVLTEGGDWIYCNTNAVSEGV